MSDTSKLPGLSRLSEADLRKQYTEELGAEVPAELTTRQGLIDAIQAHRDTRSESDAPTTALDAIEGEGGEVTSDEDSEVPGTQEEIKQAKQALDLEMVSSLLQNLNEDEFGHLLDAVMTEAHERGIVTTDAPEATDSAAPSEPQPLVAGEDELIAVKGDEERKFTRAAWDIMKADRNGWVEKQDKPAMPKDLL